MRYSVGFILVLALGIMPLVGCSDSEGTGGTGGSAGAGGSGGDGGTGGAGGTTPERAFASQAFEHLWFQHVHGLGFCPEDGMIISATIVRTTNGAGSIEGIRLVDADEQVEQPFGPSPIARDDMTSLQALIDAVPASEICNSGGGGCDPCLVGQQIRPRSALRQVHPRQRSSRVRGR